jgi:(E)-4-hydroxy-3-methylbut-2-enyl-diphosphate synthase
MSLQLEKDEQTGDFRNLPYTADPYRYVRRQTRTVMVGDVGVGGDNPIRVQSMTTTDTMDTEGTIAQAIRLVEVGCEIVRITTPTAKDAENLKNIKEGLAKRGIKVPLVADIHFNPNAAMEAVKWADKVRINPGNFADAKKFAIKEYDDDEYRRELERIEEKFKPLVLRCKELGRSMRIGTNHGSLSDRIMNRFGDTPEGMVESALEFALIAERYGYRDLIFSMKASNPKVMIQAYRLLVARMDALGMNYPLHLGVTEAGNGEDGRIKSAIGICSLLEDGLGDTIRVSLTEDPEFEIPVALRIARRYTPVEPRLLELSNIHDTTPVKVATEWPQVENILALPDARDPYHYNRRDSAALELSGIKLGGESLPLVIAPLTEARMAEFQNFGRGVGRSLPIAGGTKAAKGAPTKPDLYTAEPPLAGQAAEFNAKHSNGPTILVSVKNEAEALSALSSPVGGLSFSLSVPADMSHLQDLCNVARQAQNVNKPLFIYAISQLDEEAEIASAARHNFPVVDTLLGAARTCAAQNFNNLVLAIKANSTPYALRANRLLATRLQESGLTYPIHLIAPALNAASVDDLLIDASLAIGALLTDGIGNSVEVDYGQNSPLSPDQQVQLAFNILQAAGARSTKAEFIACPSCGRTLFDLQSTTERIKARTGHLVGVKIAVMGCIVNGLGELADADFGYMGGAPGKVNLFVGKQCVEKGVPTEEATDRLVELIKAHGRWIDPLSEEEE